MLDRRGFLLAGAGLGLTPAGVLAAPKALGADNLVVDAFVKAQGFQGVVMIGKAGQARYARAFGMADIEAGRPATVETTYAIASISKWLTATTVLKLVDQGKLSLDAPITAYLPTYRADTGAKLTLRRLLSNASGVPNLFLPAAKLDPTLTKTPVSTEEALKRFCQGDLLFEPGARFDYAFTNWIIVLAIVEAVTGQPFQDAMRRITLDPLGLTATGADEVTAARAAASYTSARVRKPNDRLPMMAATGGYFSTAPDLLRAAHLIFDTGFLSAASQKALRTVEVASDDYALGGRVRTLTIGGKPYRAGWETGRTSGYRSVVGHRCDTRETVVVLNNTDLSQRTLDLFADSLFGAAPPA
jgi:CubicO group peptidase (beta-lactamase class C family)